MYFNRKKRVITAIVCILLAVLAFFGGGSHFSSVETYDGSLDTLQEIQNQALGLTASAAGLATLAAAVPGDATTPIANKLMDLAGYMVIVFVVITLEKYLLTLTGALAFRIVLPVGFLLIGAAFLLFYKRDGFFKFILQTASKAMIVSLLLWALVPASLSVTNRINTTYDTAYEPPAEVEESQEQTEDIRDEGFSIRNFLDDIKSKTEEAAANLGSAADKKVSELEQAMNQMIEGIAVMIVTTCVIPVCVLLLFLFIIRTAVGIDIPMPKFKALPKP